MNSAGSVTNYEGEWGSGGGAGTICVWTDMRLSASTAADRGGTSFWRKQTSTRAASALKGMTKTRKVVMVEEADGLEVDADIRGVSELRSEQARAFHSRVQLSA
jgi:hypothetical protein